MPDLTETVLSQALERAVADYQRHHGRIPTIAKLEHLLKTRQEAQRILDESVARVGTPRAAE